MLLVVFNNRSLPRIVFPSLLANVHFFALSSHIQGRVQISTELKQRKLGEEPQKGSEEIRAVHKVCLREHYFVSCFPRALRPYTRSEISGIGVSGGCYTDCATFSLMRTRFALAVPFLCRRTV